MSPVEAAIVGRGVVVRNWVRGTPCAPLHLGSRVSHEAGEGGLPSQPEASIVICDLRQNTEQKIKQRKKEGVKKWPNSEWELSVRGE